MRNFLKILDGIVNFLSGFFMILFYVLYQVSGYLIAMFSLYLATSTMIYLAWNVNFILKSPLDTLELLGIVGISLGVLIMLKYLNWGLPLVESLLQNVRSVLLSKTDETEIDKNNRVGESGVFRNE